MTKKYKFIWIDDSTERIVEANNLATRLNGRMTFQDVKGKDLSAKLEEIQDMAEPDLLIIDHKLQDVGSGIFKTGSTVAAFIREKWISCPIICITGVEKSEVDFQQRALYEEMFPISNISSYDNTIMSIVTSFKVLNKKNPQNIEEILLLLKAPKDEYNNLTLAMPDDIRSNYGDKTFKFNVSHWVRKVFIEKPGFLLDRLWVATTLGIKESSFKKVEGLFLKAQYTGIFSDASNVRWWKNSIIDILAENIQEVGLPWEKGRKLSKINKRDYSECYASQKPFPQIVAFKDATPNSERAPMRIEFTLPHPKYQNIPFFEEIRMMKS